MSKYELPHAAQLAQVDEQIGERKKIITRNKVELELFKAEGNEAKISEVQLNEKTLKKQIDVLVEYRDELEKQGEDSSDSTE
jgi:predicted ATPase